MSLGVFCESNNWISALYLDQFPDKSFSEMWRTGTALLREGAKNGLGQLSVRAELSSPRPSARRRKFQKQRLLVDLIAVRYQTTETTSTSRRHRSANYTESVLPNEWAITSEIRLIACESEGKERSVWEIFSRTLTCLSSVRDGGRTNPVLLKKYRLDDLTDFGRLTVWPYRWF
jgi:hypothetical protein